MKSFKEYLAEAHVTGGLDRDNRKRPRHRVSWQHPQTKKKSSQDFDSNRKAQDHAKRQREIGMINTVVTRGSSV